MSQDFTSHFEELRRRLIVCLIAFGVASIVSYFFSHEILDFLTLPLRRYEDAPLFFQKPYEAFLAHLKISALSGFIFSSPVVFTQAWSFVVPGLYEKEKKTILPLALVSAGLFLLGVCFAYFLIIPLSLNFLLSFQTENVKPILSIAAYFSFVSGMILSFGLLFDAPVIVIGLVQLGVVNTDTLARSRKVIIVLIFLLAAVLTPSPDPLSQVLLGLPMILLFEIALRISRRVENKPNH